MKKKATKAGGKKSSSKRSNKASTGKFVLNDKTVKKLHDFFRSNVGGSYNYRQVSAYLQAQTKEEKELVKSALERLAQEKTLERVGRGKYRFHGAPATIEATFQRRNNGANSAVADQTEIAVNERNRHHALNGDTVLVRLFPHKKGAKPEGEVVKVLKRSKEHFVGVVERKGDYAFLVTHDKYLDSDILLPKGSFEKAHDHDKAIVRMVKWPENSKNPIGEVVDVLGKSGVADTEMHAILAEFDLPYRYPKRVEQAAEKLDAKITKEDIAEREDFRKVTTFTIDPADAKDFDDAISVRNLDTDMWEIGVHIADVSHYVKPGSLIDEEAYSRGCSVYLVDRTVPMLPERLCNDICSLRPNEDRLCFSVIFTIDTVNARVVNYRIRHTVINSDHRFSYEEVQLILDGEEGPYAAELRLLDQVAQKLRKERFKGGSINFSSTEVKFLLDAQSNPIGVETVVNGTAHQLIEEFMLLANRTVAKRINNPTRGPKPKTERAFIYRVHPPIDEYTFKQAAAYLDESNLLPMKLRKEAKPTAGTINRVLEQIADTPRQPLVEMVLVRTLMTAYYSCDNIGHFGLGFDYYTHFTSPIRRYPDLVVHRLIDRYLFEKAKSVKYNELSEVAEYTSKCEEVATKAERASVKYMQVRYLDTKIGKIFNGIISGVTEWGIYVQLVQSGCDGLIPIRSLEDDFYELDESGFSLIGKRYKRVYRVGEKITVRVVSCDAERRLIDFEAVE